MTQSASINLPGVLIVGSTGLIGEGLYAHLKARGFPVVGTSLFENDRDRICFELGKDAPADLANFATDKNISRAILLATYGGIDTCKMNYDASSQLNITQTIALADALNEQGITSIYASSDYVFDGETGGYVETDIRNPVTAYGAQKAAVENHFQAHLPDGLVLRFSKVFPTDPATPGLLKGWYDDLKAGKQIHCASDQRQCFTDLDDTSAAIEAAIRNDLSGLYHCCNPDGHARAELLNTFAGLLNISPDIHEVETSWFHFPSPRSKNTTMKPDKFIEATGFQFTPIVDSLKKFVEKLN